MVNSQASGVPSAPRSCAGCGGKIADRFLLFSMERYWHTRCLKCSCCQAQLGDIGTSCYSKGGMILCRSDYIRLFGHSGACSACGQSIPANEMVMRAQGNAYHLKCFSCATCRTRLMPGNHFHYINGTIFCEHDRPGILLLNSHLLPLQSSSVLTDQKVSHCRAICTPQHPPHMSDFSWGMLRCLLLDVVVISPHCPAPLPQEGGHRCLQDPGPSPHRKLYATSHLCRVQCCLCIMQRLCV
ncbi:LIM domain transcription factor LMO4.1-like isoform X1 [Notothenia coriiceps]|uniref:LIM domain transcription factor LMO4.1-like isoform X1 n=1 Tax=Notothenia coriiceps TaxID=8208 RepID=A0A6I9P7Y9_9TELE|nr:PREDICTED: LIM domain transcription factor LMO4.1-like isoform X1 [Notothenia coriiceps]